MEQGSGQQLPDHVSRHLDDQGIDPDALEPDAVRALATISLDELQVLTRVKESLDKAGVPEQIMAQIV